MRRGELDRLTLPHQPLDVLAQQIVAEVSAQDWPEDALFDRFRRAWPFRDVSRDDFSEVLRMLADGFATSRGRRGTLIHHDTINHILRGRRGARLTALTSGGTIPDTADYQVLLEPENHIVGTVNEDFAVESLAGDVFQLGNSAYRIMRVERGVVRVEDAHGQPPTIPFWLGEAPGRSDELSLSVSRLRAAFVTQMHRDPEGMRHWLTHDLGIAEPAAEQLVEYLAASLAALQCLPTQDTIVLERFFDEAGGMQLVIHSPFGSRINRAWGLALRKRFCRKFNFELQAAATEDNIVLSLTTTHSFELAEVAQYLHAKTVRPLLVQALLDAPMFTTRWRWVAGVALALPRFRGGKKVPPQLARMEAEDLVAAVFPDQIACGENIVGDREVPDHPLTNQTIYDCLYDAMDIEGLEHLLSRIESGEIRIVARDLTQPSPLALEVLSARPYAFLDDAPLEERRTQAVMARRWMAPESAAELGQLDQTAIDRVRLEAWPDPANAEELHDALLWLGCLNADEVQRVPEWSGWLAALAGDNRVQHVGPLWVAAERTQQFQSLHTDTEALTEIIRGRLEGLGPVTPAALAEPLGLRPDDIATALIALEVEGFALRGRFTPGTNAEEWCDRRLLARIHHYTVRRLRAEIEPVAARDFLRFLFAWHRVTDETRLEGPDSIAAAVALLEGFEAPAMRLGNRASAGAHHRLRTGLAGRSMPGGTRRLGAADARRAARPRARRLPCPHHADFAAATPSRAGLDLAGRTRRRHDIERPRASRAGVPARARRVVLRGTGGSDRPVAPASGRGTRRTGRPRIGHVRQFRRPARPAGPVRSPQAVQRCDTAPSHHELRHGGRRPLGADAPPCERTTAATRRGRARRAHVAAPLRRGVLAPARARGCVAAAVA